MSYIDGTGLAEITSNLKSYIDDRTQIRKYTETNPALTSVSGVATWTVNHEFDTKVVQVQVFEVSSDELCQPDVTTTDADNVSIKFTTASDISAGVYRVVVIG